MSTSGEKVDIDIDLIKPHPAQQFLLDNRKRFNVLKCGRRFGKTELCQELLAEIIEQGSIVAYFAPTYKDLYEVWNETKKVFHDIIEGKDESVKQMRMIGGAKIDFWSMDDPDSGRGRKYHRAIMDECEKAPKFQTAWEGTIRPTLTDYKGDAYFLSTPKFGDTYFKKIAKFNLTKPDWATFVYTTYDNPYIDKDEVEQARLLLDEATFRCEYLAEDLDGKAVNPFAHQFDPVYHVSTKAIFIPQKKIIISIDFNLNPFAVTFSHFWEDRDGVHDWQFDEAAIANGSVPAMIDLIKERYGQWRHNFEITGDHMGQRGDISQRDNASLYDQIQRGLGLGSSQMKVYPNPTHENSRNDTNLVLFKSKGKHEFIIHPIKCEGTVYDFRYVQCDAYGQILKRDRKDLTQRADFLDTVRYKINAKWKDYLKRL